MANIIDLFETEDKRTKSNAEKAKMSTENIIRSMKSDLEMKSEIISTSLEMYEEALKADGVRSGKLMITNLNEFIAMPAMFVFAELSDRPFVLLKEKIGNDIYLLGIDAEFGDLHELPKGIFPNEIGMIAKTSLSPFALKISSNEVLEYAGDDGWVESDFEADDFLESKKENKVSEMQQEIFNRNDASSELLRLITEDGQVEIDDEACSEYLDRYAQLINLANETSGHTTVVINGQRQVALIPTDKNHSGLLIMFKDGWFCIDQYIDGSEASYLSGVDDSDGYIRTVAKTKDICVAKRLIKQHEDARRGIYSAVTIPLSLKKLICIKRSSVDEMLKSIKKEVAACDDLSKQESNNIGAFIKYLFGLKQDELEMDQVDRVLYDLKNNPYSRRIMTNIYVHQDLHEMALYPCAYSVTFNVAGDRLNAILNQRSQDILAAGNWNVVQYAALLMMFAQVSGLKPGILMHVIADAHIYDRHVPIVEDLITRPTYPAPKVTLNPLVKDFYKFTVDDFVIKDYQTGPQIKGIPIAE